MKKHISIIAAALLLAACTTQENPVKVTQDSYNRMLTLKPHMYKYNPKKDIRIDLTITKIEQTYFLTDENIQSWYYTVYAIDNNNNLYYLMI